MARTAVLARICGRRRIDRAAERGRDADPLYSGKHRRGIAGARG